MNYPFKMSRQVWDQTLLVFECFIIDAKHDGTCFVQHNWIYESEIWKP